MCKCDDFRYDDLREDKILIEEYFVRCSECRTWLPVYLPAHIPESQRKAYAITLSAKLNVGELPRVTRSNEVNNKRVFILGEAPRIEWHVE